MSKQDLNKNGLNEEQFLQQYKESDYRRPSVTADILIFSKSNELELLMIKRLDHPYINMWALCGGFSEPNESVDESAIRELEEETGLKDIPLQQLYFHGEPNRDPRTWVLTQSYIALVDKTKVKPVASDDAKDVSWFNVSIEVKEDIWNLTLKNKNETLSATLKVTQNVSLLGENYSMKIIESETIAFDHAKIICRGLIKLRQSNIIKF